MSATSFPCPSVIANCPCDDSPFENLSAEGVDSRRVPGFFYGCAGTDGIPAVCEAETTELAELCAARECDNYTLFYSQETTCACSTDPSITYTLRSGAFIGLSQADADALAEAFACNVADLICDGSPVPELFESSPQTCEATCDDGTVSYTTITGMFTGFTQEDADALALQFACDVAALLCADGPNNPTPAPLTSAFNGRQVCSITCEGIGSQFSYAVAAGVFRANNAAQANAMAYSYACRQAMAVRFCLGDDIDDRICISEAATFNISITGVTPDTRTWSISGTLPTGMTFSNGVVSGTPTAAGSYTFTVRLTDGNGNYATRQYTVIVVAITNDAELPALEIGTPYLVNFVTSSGDQEFQQWTVIAGNLPDGLELTEAGVLHGTPTETGAFPITVRFLDSTPGLEPLSCMKDFEFPGCPVPAAYSYNCPLNAVPKSYTPPNDYFVAFNDDLNRVMTSGSPGEVEIVDFTQAVPALDFTISLDTTGRVLGGIYDPVNQVMVFCRWDDILVSQPTISFVDNTGAVLSEITLSGFGAGFKNNPYFTLLTAGTKYVVLFLSSFSVGDKSALLLIDTATRAVAVQRDFTGASATEYDDGAPAFSCEENEIVLTYRSVNSFLHKMDAEDLTTVDIIDLGIDYTLFPAYDPATNQIIAIRNTGPIRYVVYLNPITGALEHSIDMAYLGNLTPGTYNFKLLAFILGKYDNGTVHYYDSLTHTEKCSVSFVGMDQPNLFATKLSDGAVYVVDALGNNIWELTTT